MQGVLRNLIRLFVIIRVLMRYGALSSFLSQGGPMVASIARVLGYFADPALASGRPGQRLAAALETLGPTFVKFGQGLSKSSAKPASGPECSVPAIG